MSEERAVARREERMRFTVTTGSGHQVVLDDGAGNAGARPIEMVLVGLAGCTAMDVISILEKKRQVVTAYAVDTHAQERAEHPTIFTRVDVTHDIEGSDISLDAVRRAIELSAWKYCPVSAMLCGGPVELHHRYRVTPTDTGAVTDGEVVVLGPHYEPPPA